MVILVAIISGIPLSVDETEARSLLDKAETVVRKSSGLKPNARSFAGTFTSLITFLTRLRLTAYNSNAMDIVASTRCLLKVGPPLILLTLFSNRGRVVHVNLIGVHR